MEKVSICTISLPNQSYASLSCSDHVLLRSVRLLVVCFLRAFGGEGKKKKALIGIGKGKVPHSVFSFD